MTTETVAKQRIYVIQNEEGQVINVYSDAPDIDLALIITSAPDADENVSAQIQRVKVEAAAPKQEIDELEEMIGRD